MTNLSSYPSVGTAGQGSRERRVAQNDAVFQQRGTRCESEASGSSTLAVAVCECSSFDCLARIVVSSDEYERVRGRGDCFLVRPGHESVWAEVIVERHDEFIVVQNVQAAG
jgi:hypothetical protein